MKKQLFTLALLFIGALANAQISKGDVQLTGAFSLSSQDTPNGDVSQLNFNPQAGLLISETTSLGIAMNLSDQTLVVFDPGTAGFVEQDVNTFNYGVYARFYKKMADNFYMFLQPSFLLISGEIEGIGGPATDLSGFQLAAAPGLSYFFNSKWALEVSMGSLGYTQNKQSAGGNETEVNSFVLDVDLSNINIGLSLFLRKNQ